MSSLTSTELDFILRRDFMSFNERAFYTLNPATRLHNSVHVEVLASKLEQCRLGKIKRLIVNIPPRSLKSHTVSVAFVAWLLGHNPAARIVCASYGKDLAEKHARDCRAVMTAPFYRRLFPNTRLSRDKSSINEYKTTQEGFRMSTSVEGPLTGFGGDIVIIDDPQKPSDAMSDTQRKNVNEWYDGSLLMRLDNKVTGCIIIVMQRLHQDDLVGHVLEQEDWEVVSFPAIAEENEEFLIESPLGNRVHKRSIGDVLDPEREPLAILNLQKRRIGEYAFSSQYQQNPIPVGGAIIKTEWFKHYEPGRRPNRFSCMIQSWDTANKAGELNDYSVCSTWGVYDLHYFLLDVFRQRLNYPDLKRAAHQQYEKWKPDSVVIEDKASGTQLIQDLKAEGLYFVKPYDPPPATDKQIRLHAQSAEFESGRVLLPQTAPWLDIYIRELITFPGSKYDDQVDSTTQALDYLKQNRDLEIWAKLGRRSSRYGR